MNEVENENRVLNVFRRVAAEMPWYQALLAEQGVSVEQVSDLSAFSRRCPILTKRNTFERFPVGELAAATRVADIATVLTSSGHGGKFSFGLSNRSQALSSGGFIDQAMDEAFRVNSQSTLCINCLPMGVGFSSERMTVATTSVREDMALALVNAFGSSYDQILLVAGPLFMKRFMDYAAAQAMDWSRHRVHVVLGEEIFGEYFRAYLEKRLCLNPERPDRGYIMSSFGVGELGLHLCHETPATIALRRAASIDPDFARELLGVKSPGEPLPMILTFNPLRTFIEVVQPDSAGYGKLTISMLDADLPIPLLRYQTGDVARLLHSDTVAEVMHRQGIAVPQQLPQRLLALQGRSNASLPNGAHTGAYKDALYADPRVASQLTGAFRLSVSGGETTIHVQLAASDPAPLFLDEQLLRAIPGNIRPAHLVAWPFDRFPFGMGLDYERKFRYYVPEDR